MSPSRPLALAGALVAAAMVTGGCSAGGVSRPPGFSAAYEPATDGAGILRAIAGSGAGNAWAVGDDGAAVRLGANTFTAMPTGAAVSLGGLTVLDVSHAFAVERGGSRVFAWGGGAWAPLGEARADRAAAATFAASTTDVFVAGNGVERWNGTAWTLGVPGGATFTSMSGSFDTDVWAVGPGGAQHWNGTAWSAVPTPPNTPPLSAVWVGGVYDAWMVGAAGTVLHWTGSTFTPIVTPTTMDLTAIWGTGTFDIWAGGQGGLLLHWDGNVWNQYTSPAGRTIESLWTSRGSDLFFVDGAPTITRLAR